MDRHAQIESAVAASASKATYTGAGTSVIGWMTSTDFALFFGMAMAVCGFFLNWFYKRREDQRRQKADERSRIEHEARMMMLRGGDDV